MGNINISKYSKAEVLKALYDGSKPLGMGILHYDTTPITIKESQSFIDMYGKSLKENINYIKEQELIFLETHKGLSVNMIQDVKTETKKSIENAKNQSFYFDYLKGRVMKISLASDILNPSRFDRDNGEGEAERLINGISENNADKM